MSGSSQPASDDPRQALGASRIVAGANDPCFDDFRRLVDTQHRRRFERERRLAIAEGFPLVARLFTQSVSLRTLLTTPQAHARVAALGVDPARVVTVPGKVISEVVGFEFRRNVIGSFDRPPVAAVSDLLGGASRLAVVEAVNDAENLGSIFRAAAAFGVDAVIVDRSTIDPFYRRCIRVSMGAAMVMPHAVVADVAGFLPDLHAAGFSSVAMTTNRSARPLASWSPASRVAVLIGAEGSGLSPPTVAGANAELTIPVTDKVDSLNVAHAAAIAFYHLSSANR